MCAPRRSVRLAVALTLGVGAAACGQEPARTLDVEVEPVTEGEWYRPAVDVSWQWQLQGDINAEYDVDLYDVDLFEAPDEVISTIHARGAAVFCYFSAGSSETGRPDVEDLPASALGNPLEGYPDERWLDIRSPEVFGVMLARLDLAKKRGCDGVEPDNVTGFSNDSGFALTASDQLAFNRNLANEAHARGLAVALKNDGAQVPDLIEFFDLEVNEQCHEYDECSEVAEFVARNKPVLNAEYASDAAAASQMATTICPLAESAGLRTLILPLELDDSFRVSCF